MKGRLSIYLGLAFLLPLFILFFIGPFVLTDPTRIDLLNSLKQPGSEGLLGTDDLGRDLLSRIAHGGRLSFLLGLGTAILSVGFGSFLGMLAGLKGGWVDRVSMRVVEFLFAIPSLLIAVALSLALKPGPFSVLIALALVSWAAPARMVRGESLALSARPFIEAARAMGASPFRIAFHHCLPNLMGLLTILFSIALAAAVLGESTLSFLGLGVQPPAPTLGGMIYAGKDLLQQAPHVAGYPGLVLALFVLGVNFLGDGLKDKWGL